jgi:DtxR family Mn-dependent transcriptional regulator
MQSSSTNNIYITPTMEDYLEAICNLADEKRVVRVRDIALRLGVKMPTVISMLKSLSEKGMVNYKKYEYLELTRKGSAIGRQIARRHQTLKRFLTDILQVDHNQADEDACKMEHAVSSTTLERMVDFMEFIANCPRGGNKWLEHFNEYRRHGQPKDLAKCVEQMKRFVGEYSDRIREMEGEQ